MNLQSMKMEVPKALKDLVEDNQAKLKKAIIFHQSIYQQLLIDGRNEELHVNLLSAEQEVVRIGLEQKVILQKLRSELQSQSKQSQKNSGKCVLEEKKQQLSSNLVRSRKQKIAPKVSPKASCSDDSNDGSATSSSPKAVNGDTPELVAQIEFLVNFSLTTLDHFKEMQNKRVERKRRTTANPNFIYENDLPSKRRKNNYPASISPPHTRQAVKKKNGRGSPPNDKSDEKNNKLSKRASSESIPEMISESTNEGLLDEILSTNCNRCKNDGAVLQCEICSEGYHENCGDSTFVGASKRCSRCIHKKKAKKKLGTLEQVEAAIVEKEKIMEKRNLQDQNENLCAELTQLQDRHSQLSISLKKQKVRQEELLSDRQNTEEKIKCILNFIEGIKKSPMTDETRN